MIFIKHKILIAQNISKTGLDLLESKGYILVYAQTEDRDHMKEVIQDCQGVISKTFFLDKDILSCAKGLRVIGKHGIGVDNVVNVADATKLGIYVCNTPLANCSSVAEHTIGFILALSKNFSKMDKAVRRNDFGIADRMPACDLSGKTLGLIGFGNVGKLVARMAHAGFDMKVQAYDPYALPGPDYVTMTDALDQILKTSDYVSLHIPALPETVHLIGIEQLKKMKPSAFLINCARGSVVDEGALVRALADDMIRGAAVDVYETEPPLPDNPLLKLPNVLLTPHSAALSTEAMERMSYGAAMGVDEVLSGRKPTWCVNWNKI